MEESEEIDSEDDNEKMVRNAASGHRGRKPQSPEKKAMRELYNFLMK